MLKKPWIFSTTCFGVKADFIKKSEAPRDFALSLSRCSTKLVNSQIVGLVISGFSCILFKTS